MTGECKSVCSFLLVNVLNLWEKKMGNSEEVDKFIKSGDFSNSLRGSVNTKIRRFNPNDNNYYCMDIGNLSVIVNTDHMPECICIVHIEGEIVLCINSNDSEVVKERMLKLNPDIKEYTMTFRPIFS